LGPGCKAVERRAAPEACAGHHIRVKDDPQDLLPLRTLSMARETAA
jgi:hypothetical protein